ncbi:hypothetical protein HDU98_001828, partial [Podochytrium sp. JEL0797]
MKLENLKIDWSLATAAALGAVSAIAIMSVTQTVSRRQQIKKMKSDHAFLSTFPPPPQPQTEPPESLIREQLSRNYSFLGEDGMSAIRDSFVVVVGVGGVGSHAAHMLVRSGVKKIRVIDFDQVSLSSLNRHAVAVHKDVGTSKVECLKRHFGEIAPGCVVEPVVELFSIDVAEKVLAGNPDYVLDCIDNIKTKIDLLKYCHDHNIKVISSM